MGALSEDQARELADEYLAVAEAVSDFRSREFANLSANEVLALKSLEQKLSNQADDLTAMAIQLALDDLDQTIDHIVKTTGDARDAIARLNDVRKAVAIAAHLVDLGAAITTGNAEGILTALQNTKDSFAA